VSVHGRWFMLSVRSQPLHIVACRKSVKTGITGPGWNWKGIVHYELPPGQTIDSNLYCQELERLRQARECDQNWLIGKASSSITTTLDPTHFWRSVKNWEELGWDILTHPSYSPSIDLASSGYHSFFS